MGMRPQFVIPVLASILVLGTIGLAYDVFADKDDNSGNNGCEKSNPKSKACEKNPNSKQEPTIDPTSGSFGTKFTITDPQGRMTCADTIIFTRSGSEFGHTIRDASFSADGKTATGTNSFLIIAPGIYDVTVHCGDPLVNPPLFDALQFAYT